MTVENSAGLRVLCGESETTAETAEVRRDGEKVEWVRRRNDVCRTGVAKPARRFGWLRREYPSQTIGRCCEGERTVIAALFRSTQPIYIIPATHPVEWRVLESGWRGERRDHL